MLGRPLKNYDFYKKKIIAYAKVISVKLEFAEYQDEGIYFPAKRKIKVDDELEQSTEIAVLLHELGHEMDDFDNSLVTSTGLSNAYRNVYSNIPTKLQLNKVLKCEKTAWNNGRLIAKRIGIRLGKWYDNEEKSALKDYRSNETR